MCHTIKCEHLLNKSPYKATEDMHIRCLWTYNENKFYNVRRKLLPSFIYTKTGNSKAVDVWDTEIEAYFAWGEKGSPDTFAL